jgi:chromosome segregation ATPase
MSTAGKILAVLISLVAVVMVLLAASVTQLNRNGAQALEALKGQVERLAADVAKSRNDLRKFKDDTHFEQASLLDKLAVLEGRQAGAEEAKSEVLEAASRVQHQLAAVKATVDGAKVQSAQRLAERKAETAALADAVKGIESLSAQNDELIGRLTNLRDHFQQTLRQNKELTDRLLKSRTRTTRPASLTPGTSR